MRLYPKTLSLLICLLFLTPCTSDATEWQFGAGAYGTSIVAGSKIEPKHPIHKPHKKRKKQKRKRRDRVGEWYGYPTWPSFRRSLGHSNIRGSTQVIIQKETIIKEVQVKPSEPERIWTPPVYEIRIIQGHWTHGVQEVTGEDGIRSFTDDNGESIWVPEKKERIIIQEGYYQ